MKGKPISLKIKGQIFISFFQYFNIAIKKQQYIYASFDRKLNANTFV